MGERTAKSIFEEITAQILRGEWQPGERLPAERKLALRYQTSRNTLREALQMLVATHLVEVQHGRGVTVLDFRSDANMNCIEAYLSYAPVSDEQRQVLADLFRARLEILEMSIEMAIERASDVDLARVELIIREQQENLRQGNREALDITSVALIDAIVTASGSLVARWIANSVMEIYLGLLERTPALWVYDDTFALWLSNLLEAFRQRDAVSARKATHQTIAATDAKVIEMLRTSKES